MSLSQRRGLVAALTLGAVVAAVPLARAATTQGSGRLVTETRDPGAFSAIASDTSLDIVVRPGARESVQVRLDDNLLPLLETVVETRGDQRTLHVRWKRGESISTRSKAEITIDVVNLRALSLSGSGHLSLEALTSPQLALSVAGSSDARLKQLDLGELKVSIAGSGDVMAAGRAGKLTVSIAGSGNVSTRELKAEDAGVSIAGSGNASITASREVSVSIAGSGDVEYGGGARLARKRVAGSGSVRER